MSDSEDSPDSTAFAQLLGQVASSPAPNILPDGSSIGEYRVTRLLGRGAFGAVYHATHLVIGKQVALKVLGTHFSEDAAMAARFVDEARAVNRIAHPNIVDIFGFGALPDGRKYCVMELLSGQTLGERLEHGGLPAFAEALAILGQIAGALDAAHQNGIVHRDLKPDNVFLCRTGSDDSADGGAIKVKLLDFGIAQIADGVHQRTGTNMILGTPAYMSPEQCRGARVDHRSDIYALGVVAFEMFTGTQPFHGANAFQLASQHVTAQPPVPSALRPELPQQLDAAILRMLAKLPEDRPQSASAAVRELALALALAIDGLEGAAAAAAPRSLHPESRGQRRGVWLGAIAVLLLAVALVAFRHWRSQPVGTLASREGPSASAAPAPSHAPAALDAVAGSTAPAPQAELGVQVKIDGEPASARVFSGDAEVGQVGHAFTVPRSDVALRLSVRASGFAPRDVSVVPSENRTLSVKLRRLGAKKNPELEY